MNEDYEEDFDIGGGLTEEEVFLIQEEYSRQKIKESLD